jgi:cupin 2 domain-containing protein
VQSGNLFPEPSNSSSAEAVEILWSGQRFFVERIVSQGHATPPGQWYDQDTDEWAVLLGGAARRRVEGRQELLEVRPGDYVLLPAHRRHRVDWTDPDRDSVWLANHARPASALP